MGEEVKVSVVVPVYNAEKTLEHCVNSILQQSYTNWELLLIDDGSTDRSKEICRKYCQSDKRISYFYKENGGASSARNLGITKATGKFITFIDSDDWIELETVEKLLTEALSSHAEYTIPRMRIVIFNEKEECIEERYDMDEEAFRVDRLSIKNNFLATMKKGILFSASGRLYSLDFITRNKIKFPEEVKLLEDFCFNLKCLEKSALLSHISYIAYNFYVKDIEQYVLKRKYEEYYTGICEVYSHLRGLFSDVGIKDNKYYNNFFISYWTMALNAVEKQEKDFIKKYRFQRRVALEVHRERIINNYSIESVDRSIRYLFLTRQPVVYQIVRVMQKLKKKIWKGK